MMLCDPQKQAQLIDADGRLKGGHPWGAGGTTAALG